MGLTKKVDLLNEVEDTSYLRGWQLTTNLLKQFNTFHAVNNWGTKEVETILLKQKQQEVEQMGVRGDRPSTYIFSPSGASKCSLELYLKAIGTKAVDETFPYQRRWTRNSSAVHEVIQRDLLYMSRMKNPAFTVKMAENGLPMWEQNLKTHKMITHDGETFAVLGMMDGILNYQDGSEIGFEFKTKTNSIGQVGNYKMKAPTPQHAMQCTAYSILFGMDEFVMMYECVAKDQWNKGAEAKIDIRAFYLKVTEEDKNALLTKFANVVKAVKTKTPPAEEPEKCLFCPYKYICQAGGRA